jgi:hypothetical protein
MRASGLTDLRTVECLLREYEVYSQELRVDLGLHHQPPAKRARCALRACCAVPRLLCVLRNYKV